MNINNEMRWRKKLVKKTNSPKCLIDFSFKIINELILIKLFK